MKIEFTEIQIKNLINALKTNLIILNDMIKADNENTVLKEQLSLSELELLNLTLIVDKENKISTLTENEKLLFIELCEDAPNWSGSPLWNQCGDKTLADNATLGSLVKKKLVTTMEDETLGDFSKRTKGFKKNKIQYVSFTAEGISLAVSMGFKAEYFQN